MDIVKIFESFHKSKEIKSENKIIDLLNMLINKYTETSIDKLNNKMSKVEIFKDEEYSITYYFDYIEKINPNQEWILTTSVHYDDIVEVDKDPIDYYSSDFLDSFYKKLINVLSNIDRIYKKINK